jgi:hypothetical protein
VLIVLVVDPDVSQLRAWWVEIVGPDPPLESGTRVLTAELTVDQVSDLSEREWIERIDLAEEVYRQDPAAGVDRMDSQVF